MLYFLHYVAIDGGLNIDRSSCMFARGLHVWAKEVRVEMVHLSDRDLAQLRLHFEMLQLVLAFKVKLLV